MAFLVKEYMRNSEGEQSFDAEVFLEEKDALAYMNGKVSELIKNDCTLKISEKHHTYLIDEEQGGEFEYIIIEKTIYGIPSASFEEKLKTGVDQILVNGWSSEWLDYGTGRGNIFSLSKRFTSKQDVPYFIHMDTDLMRMVYVLDEARKHNEDRGSFECSAVFEPNEITLIHESQKLSIVNHEAFSQYDSLISMSDAEEMLETHKRVLAYWNSAISGE